MRPQHGATKNPTQKHDNVSVSSFFLSRSTHRVHTSEISDQCGPSLYPHVFPLLSLHAAPRYIYSRADITNQQLLAGSICSKAASPLAPPFLLSSFPPFLLLSLSFSSLSLFHSRWNECNCKTLHRGNTQALFPCPSVHQSHQFTALFDLCVAKEPIEY